MAQQKWNLGDIRPPERESRMRSKRPMQDVVVPVSRTKETSADTSDSARAEDDTFFSESPQKFRQRGDASTDGRRKKVFWGSVVLLLLFVGFLATLFLQGAEVTVYPKSKDATIQAAFTAYQKPEVNMLGYEFLTLEETGERTVTATRSEKVDDQARGTITIYNAFSAESQRLKKNTRVESPTGLIFKINESAVVPGYIKDSSGKVVPGSVEAQVFADVAGDAYNIAPMRFTIPGLKDSPQFDTMYAESHAPMQGGFVGDRLIVEPTELAKAQEAVHAELQEKLLGRMRTERPVGFELYESAARVRFESLPSVDAGNTIDTQQATIRERALLEIPLFAEGDFAAYLAKNTIDDYGNEEVRIENPQSLAFSYITASSSPATLSSDALQFNLAGTAKIVWKYDTEKLRTDLVGSAKAELPNIILKYQPAIERATVLMRPFWKQAFPEKPQKIKIVEIVESPTE